MSLSSYGKKFRKSKYLGDKTRVLKKISNQKNVVHLGCTDWPNQIEQILKNNLLHTRVLDVARSTLGVDVDLAGISHLQELYPDEEFLCGDVSNAQDIQQRLIDFKPDYLLIPDVLEHIENSRDFLMGVGKVLLKTDAIGVFTTPNSFALKTYIPVFFGLDFTHPDHCSIHNEFTIEHAMNDANLKVLKIGYISRDISDRYGLLVQILTRPIDWFCRLFPRFSDTLYIEVTANN